MDSEENKMKTSDTPRSDAAEYHQYDTQPPLPLGLVDVEFARKLETELNTAIVNEAFAENKVYTLEKQLKQANERIKQRDEWNEGLDEIIDRLTEKIIFLSEIRQEAGVQDANLREKLSAANERIKQLEELYEGEIGEHPELLGLNVLGLLKRELNSAQNRIKRLEDAGDVLFENSYPSMWDLPAAADQKLTDQSNWLKAKEAKL